MDYEKYLRKNDLNDGMIEEIILAIAKTYRAGNSFIGLTFNKLEECGLEINEKNMQEILNYLVNIYNNTILWVNNGWTPAELMKNR